MIRPGGGAALEFLPRDRSLPSLAAAARGCRACDLCERATQTVFGEGPPSARLVLIGEQPGDQEDLAGALSSDRRVRSSTRRWQAQGSRGRRST